MFSRILLAFALSYSLAYTMEQAEIDKVNKLIDKVGTMTSYKFIRNDSEYDVADAMRLMRYKLDHQQKDLKTVDDYIDTCLNKSSSGKDYKVKDDKGTITGCPEMLKKWAKEIAEQEAKAAKDAQAAKKAADIPAAK